MKQTLFTLILTITFNLVFSQSEDDTDSTNIPIPFVAYWALGDSYRYKITKTQHQWKGETQLKERKEEYMAKFEVVDSTATSYTINWTIESSLPSIGNVLPKEVRKILEDHDVTSIEYKTDEVGTFLEVTNWEEIRDLMNSVLDELSKEVVEKSPEQKASFEKVVNTVKAVYGSKQGIEGLLAKELQYFHFPMGVEFDPKETIHYEEKIPNMFGGKPLKANSKIFFENVDYENGFCTFHNHMDLDPDDTKKMLLKMFSEMGLDNKKIKKKLKSAHLTIQDRNTYDYFYYPGLPQKISTIRDISFEIGKEKGKRVEQIIIELALDE